MISRSNSWLLQLHSILWGSVRMEDCMFGEHILTNFSSSQLNLENWPKDL